MKFRSILFGLFIVCSISSQAQTEITSASFIEPGDVIKTITTTQINANYVAPGGEDQTWDFSGLTGGIQQEITYFPTSDAVNDSLFPTATCVQFLGQGGGEQFFESTSEHFAALGVVGGDPTGIGFSTNTIYDQPYVQRRVMTYVSGETFNTDVAVVLRFSVDDLPGELSGAIDSVGGGLIDSIGVGLGFSREDVIDGWGTMKIPGGTYDVLRETRTEERTTVIEAKLPFLGWQDISGLVGGLAGGFGGLVNDTTVSQVYLSNDAKEPIAAVTLSDDLQSAISVSYKDLGVSGTGIIIEDAILLSVSPNPTTGPIQIQIENLPEGKYQMGIHDLAGRLLNTQTFTSANKIILTESTDKFTSGIYFLSIKTEAGDLIATQKLVFKK